MDLFEIIHPINEATIHKRNKKKDWAYGYDIDSDLIIISKTGEIGDIYHIQGLKVALPKAPKEIYKRSEKKEEQYWQPIDMPKPLKKIKTTTEWDSYPSEFKEEWSPYIEEEFKRREEGFWFKNNGVDTYITGSHYMYLQWSPIDIGLPEFREANRIRQIHWEACKADNRCYGQVYVKIRRSGFSSEASAEAVNLATINKNKRIGIQSKTGKDAQMMFTDKVVPISTKYPFFFKPIQAGMDRPKTELAYRVPAERFTKKKLKSKVEEEEDEYVGLDTSIDWRSTGDNSYDGEKLFLLIEDESGKLEKPNNILNGWRVRKTCLRLGRKIVGKCLMGSTVNPKAKGGAEFETLFRQSDATKRGSNGQTTSGLYSLFIPMEWNTEGYIDRYGMPVMRTPKKPIMGIDGELINIGAIEAWEAECDNLKGDPDSLNEYYRQYPRSLDHAFRDEAKNSLFNLVKIYEQVDFNNEINAKIDNVTKGNFEWVNGILDSTVRFVPNNRGKFQVSWIPPFEMQNRIIRRNGLKHPANEHLGAFGCDPYDISGTVDGRGSKGSLHGLTKFNMDNAPSNHFFLRYNARPQKAEIFFEDVLMALIFYGMPLLAENNKPRLLYHLKKRGYRAYSMNRPDKLESKLSSTEREIGGIPNSSQDIIQSHAAAIESYITDHVGVKEDGEYGSMYFSETLNDWAAFNINKRTLHDDSISSGLAIMACNRLMYKPVPERGIRKIDFGIQRYEQSGFSSTKID